MEKKQIVFLYTELASYVLACVAKLIETNEVDVHIVRYPINEEAPFQFKFSDKINIYERADYKDSQLLELVNSINPSVIICSGWIDKGYLKVCKAFKNKSITVLALDNHWRGDIKQRIASWLSPFYLKSRFSNCWVPGKLQQEYAKKLGFKNDLILTGFYSCDFDLFNGQYFSNKKAKEILFPKRFIYVGRYYEFKGINDLWKAFIELQNESPNEWELWCLGSGDIAPVIHPKVKHFGFVQPADLPSYIKNTGVFVLPSHFEPWGVVVHEYAAAGFPIVCSSEVGAGGTFVENGYNGYIYNSGDVNQLKVALKKIMKLSDNELNGMSERSVEKGKQITVDGWVEKLMSLLKIKIDTI